MKPLKTARAILDLHSRPYALNKTIQLTGELTVRSVLRNAVAEIIGNPDVDPVKGHASRISTCRKRTESDAVCGANLGEGVAERVGYPDIAAVKGDTISIGARDERTQVSTVRGANLRHGTAISIRDPDVSSVKSHGV